MWSPNPLAWGAFYVICSLGLLALPVFLSGRIPLLAAYVMSLTAAASLPIIYVSRGQLVGVVIGCTLTAGLCVGAFRAWAGLPDRAHGADLLVVTLAFSAVGAGAVMLFKPLAYGTLLPHLRALGATFVLAGLIAIWVQFKPPQRLMGTWLGNVPLAFALILYGGIVGVPLRVWGVTLFSVGFGVVLICWPWVQRWIDQADPHSLGFRLTFMVVIAVALPVVIAAGVTGEQRRLLARVTSSNATLTDLQRTTDDSTYGMVVGLVVIVALAGAATSRRLVRPMSLMVDAVEELVTGNIETSLPSSDTTEVLRLTVALGQARGALAQLQTELRDQALRDPLTNLFNRRYLRDLADKDLAAALRRGRLVLIIDLDHFKEHNDSLGHQAGDDLLRRFGDLLNDSIRAEDVACRYGGDEFVVIFPDASLADAMSRADSLRQTIERHLSTSAFQTSASIGVAACPDHGQTFDELVAAADSALYRAKSDGRNQVRVAGRDRRPVDDVDSTSL